jgi:lysophospholipase L1-like esterase
MRWSHAHRAREIGFGPQPPSCPTRGSGAVGRGRLPRSARPFMDRRRALASTPISYAQMPCSRVRVACVGDSLTRGDGLHEHPPKRRVPAWRLSKRNLIMRVRGNYPMLLSRLLGRRFFDVRNFGRGASTACNLSASAGPPYASTPHFAAALRFQPHIVILMLGTNDAKGHLWRGPCKGAFESSYMMIVSAFLTASNPPKLLVVLKPPPMLGRRVFGIERALLGDVESGIEQAIAATVSKQQQKALPSATLIIQAPPLPMGSTDDGIFTFDRLHLNANGSGLVACAAHESLRAFARREPLRELWSAAASSCSAENGAKPQARSCFDPFCADEKSDVDGMRSHRCTEESGIGAAFVLTGHLCTPLGATSSARAVCKSLRARHEAMRGSQDGSSLLPWPSEDDYDLRRTNDGPLGGARRRSGRSLEDLDSVFHVELAGSTLTPPRTPADAAWPPRPSTASLHPRSDHQLPQVCAVGLTAASLLWLVRRRRSGCQ